MTLVWQPDPESTSAAPDPAENLWKEIECKLNKRNPTKAKRGQWVLTPKVPAPGGASSSKAIQPRPEPTLVAKQLAYQNGRSGQDGGRGGYVDGDIRRWETENDGAGVGVEMERAESEFTVSAYFDPDLTTPRVRSSPPTNAFVREGTALFDMSAPLIYSKSRESATPANTPQIRPETIRRAPRVGGHSAQSSSMSLLGSRSRSRTQMGLHPSSRTQSRTGSTDHGLDIVREKSVPESVPGSGSDGVGIYRLDSHVVAALQALGGATPGEALDMALSSSGSGSGSGSYATAATAIASTRSDSNGSTGSMPSMGSRSTRSTGVESDDLANGSGSGEMGLGMGMGMRLDSIYSLITNTAPRRQIQRPECRSKSSLEFGSSSELEHEDGDWNGTREKMQEEDKVRVGSLLVTDLDTGHKLDLSLS